jgi:hypothetical protein
MRYRLVITVPVDKNFREHFQWIRERSPQGAEAWRARIIEGVKSLDFCTRAPPTRKGIRRIHCGNSWPALSQEPLRIPDPLTD